VTVYHLAKRPAWTCTVCGDPYPCETRRAQLVADFEGAHFQFTLFMSMDFIAAAGELPGVPAKELHTRFFWYRDGRGS